jgi:hypothetical protein
MAKWVLSFLVALPVAVAAGGAAAQEAEVTAEGAPPDPQPPPDDQGFPYGPPPIPPHAEEAPVAGAGGAYCYNGPHPVDTRSAAGPSWDDSGGVHTHFYPPLDTRLFSFQDGCYTFIGDPVDFGYQGQTYSYYGAHPLPDLYGGGWCFMIGAHAHSFSPWSPSFAVVGPWYYWSGPYDATFWSYWPYYSYYYRSYYPRYYAGGRLYRSHEIHVAPPIRRVPVPSGYAGAAGRGYRGAPPGWRGTPTPWRGNTAPAPAAPPTAWRGSPPTASGTPAPQTGGWRGTPPAPPPPPVPSIRPGGGTTVVAPPVHRVAPTLGGHAAVRSGVRR